MIDRGVVGINYLVWSFVLVYDLRRDCWWFMRYGKIEVECDEREALEIAVLCMNSYFWMFNFVEEMYIEVESLFESFESCWLPEHRNVYGDDYFCCSSKAVLVKSQGGILPDKQLRIQNLIHKK